MNLIYRIILIISFCCAMRMWVINVGIIIPIFKIFQILFILFFLLNIYKFKNLKYKILKNYIVLIWFWFFLVLLSIVPVFFDLNNASLDQSLKGIITLVVDTIFFTFLIYYFSTIDILKRNKIILYFVYGVIFSASLEIYQIYFQFTTGEHLNSIIWNTLSYNTNYTFRPGLEMNAVWRAEGVLGGPNPAGLYISTTILFFLSLILLKTRINYILIFVLLLIGGVLTFSRSGFLIPFFTSLFLFLIYMFRNKFINIIYFFLLFILPISYLYLSYSEIFDIYINDRTSIDYSRLDIYKNAFELWMLNPLGVGFNLYDVEIKNLFGLKHDENPHNSWLAILVEIGIQGLVWYLLYFLFIIYFAIKRNHLFSKIFSFSLIGILLGALFNMTFDLFFIQFWITIFFSYIICRNDNEKNDSDFVFYNLLTNK